ncbi:MAG: ATP-binding cassette domain-containing protein [Methanothrix soehngenii]|jgi:ATPase subunit of ABC transporter with duplicated ATPase domains|nr:ATP-binding cassette domain-containing protein [Methanothrix soehngenii]
MMLSVKELVIRNHQQDLVLIEGLSFTVNDEDKIAIIGSEGSGKSTLLSTIYGEVLDYITVTGEIIRPKVISYLNQNILNQYESLSVTVFLELNIPEDLYHYLDVIYKLFVQFNLSYDAFKDRSLKSLSGGERVKIGLIKCLMIRPDLLLLDEPSNDLDFETIEFLESFMKDTTIPLLFISHDQRLLENVATGIIHLQQVHKKTKPKTYFLNVDYKTYKEKYLRKFETDLMVARKQRADYNKKMDKFRQIYQKVEHQQDQAVRDPVLGRLLKKKIKSLKSQEKRYLKEKDSFIDIPEKEEPMSIYFEDLGKFNSNKLIMDLDIIDFSLPNGVLIPHVKLKLSATDKVVITGHNGVGKTTLIKHIYEKLIKRSVKVGYISQDYLDLMDKDRTVLDYVLSHQSKYQESKIRQILSTLGLKRDEMLYKIKDISEGTKLKILLLVLVSNTYDVLILDEPTRNISPINQDEMYELFLNFQGAILAVSHDRAFIESVFDEIYVLSKDGLY